MCHWGLSAAVSEVDGSLLQSMSVPYLGGKHNVSRWVVWAAVKGCSHIARSLKAKKFLDCFHFNVAVLNWCLVEGWFFHLELSLVHVAGGQLVSISIFCDVLLIKDVPVPYNKCIFIIHHSSPPHTWNIIKFLVGPFILVVAIAELFITTSCRNRTIVLLYRCGTNTKMHEVH